MKVGQRRKRPGVICALCMCRGSHVCMHESLRDSVVRQRAVSQLVCSSSCKGHYRYINTNAWACNTIRLQRKCWKS